MRVFVAITANEWFPLYASKAEVEEVSFWRAHSTRGMRIGLAGGLKFNPEHAGQIPAMISLSKIITS